MAHLRKQARDSRGITGLETAVMALSFLLVASLLGISVVKMGGIASSETTEVIDRQLTETVPLIKTKGLIIGLRTGDGKE